MCRIGVFLFLIFISNLLTAQIPADLSNITSAQISDAQLGQLKKQAESSGISQQDLERELLRRGLPPDQMMILKERMVNLGNTNVAVTEDTKSQDLSGKRNIPDISARKNLEIEPVKKSSRIFGSELFSNENLSFEPDLKMATPKNYVIGPEDQLILNIYGLNLSQQNLKVSPDGKVNIRYAGVIQVGGLSIEGATALIKSKLSKFYPGLSNGQTKIDIALGDIRSIQVILIGAIKRPGTYTLPSLANLFNALYVSGGPAENGSFRNIELIRGNKVIVKADLYDFLSKGIQQGNYRLEHNDVIRVPFAKLLIDLDGQLNRPGIFELKQGETLADAIEYAGGMNSQAFKGRITGKRIHEFEKSVVDIPGDSLAFFLPRNGDAFVVDSVINRYQNRVIISGAVYKPGEYALVSGMTVDDLIQKAHGLKDDVFQGRATLVRTRTDLTKEFQSVDLRKLLNEGIRVELRKEDSLHVSSIFDLRETKIVTINGAVRKPGEYQFEDSLSLKSLILKANGFTDNATGFGIEISRRKRDINVNTAGSKIVDLFQLNMDKDLAVEDGDYILQPFDIVTIKEDPYYKKQISVKVSGEVLMPSTYSLESREERLSSLIKRAGGMLYTANIKGAKLVRTKKEIIDSSEVKRLIIAVEKDTLNNTLDQVKKSTTDVAIDLNYILQNPGSENDIILEDGDELIIPRLNNTVSIIGEVYKPLDIMYEKGKGFNSYLSSAGGVTQLAKKGRSFIIYPNGSSAKTKKLFGIFNNYPEVQPGSQIFVPQKPKRSGLDTAKAGILVSALTAIITGIALLSR